jgi:hypothetical protein
VDRGHPPVLPDPVTRRLALLAAAASAVLGLTATPANACVGAPCTLMCTVVSTPAFQKVFGPTPCPR